jgi:25S rRNA (adenine2142-N1)-methyltransferase
MVGNNKKRQLRKRQRPVPLVTSSSASQSSTTATQPTTTAGTAVMMKSRKKARQVTTLFHKLTKQRDDAMARNDTHQVQLLDRQIEEMGGRAEYQRASVLSTSFHSTSKWVLGQLAQNGWLYGIREEVEKEEEKDDDDNNDDGDDEQNQKQKKKKRPRDLPRRTTRILEVGAINTELLDAAVSASAESSSSSSFNPKNKRSKRNNIHVRAIDIHSMVKGRIEEYDFLELPYIDEDPSKRYDCIVCSMVINCVTMPEKRGEMLARLYHHLRPGGLCYLTLPKFCLIKSAFLTAELFKEMLGRSGVGFHIEATKCSPRVSFFVLRRPLMNDRPLDREGHSSSPSAVHKMDPKWTKLIVRNKGPKFPNQFSVVLDKNLVLTGKKAQEQS